MEINSLEVSIMPKTFRPILFQGNTEKKVYFEGWYYKQVTKDETELISFIPGISLNETDKHCFVQYISVTKDHNHLPVIKTDYFPYPIDQFITRDEPFQVQIGQNVFSEKKVAIHLTKEGTKIKGSFSLHNLHPIQKTWLNPTIMGPLSYIPNMECNHGVISMNHSINGYVKINNRVIDFTGGKGYFEKDWGTSFPKEYMWIQSNNFKDPTTSLFFSVANVPLMKLNLEGFICNLVMQGKEYRFATYNRSKMTIQRLSSTEIKIILENKNARLTIVARPDKFGELTAPQNGVMGKKVKEGFSDHLHITLENFQAPFVYKDDGKMAGIEVVGYQMTD